MRSSQPLVGLKGKRCEADEKLLDLYRCLLFERVRFVYVFLCVLCVCFEFALCVCFECALSVLCVFALRVLREYFVCALRVLFVCFVCAF